LIVEITRDLTVPGEEAKFGGGKVIRDGMGQSPAATRAKGGLDLVITNAIIIDWWGVVKADIGIRDGRIVGIGKAGNSDLMDGVTKGMEIGPCTEVLSAEGKILTAGGIDTHIHFICPQIITEALANGLTTLIGGGTGPATGTNATTCTPGPWNIHRMLEAADVEAPVPEDLGAGGGEDAADGALVGSGEGDRDALIGVRGEVDAEDRVGGVARDSGGVEALARVESLDVDGEPDRLPTTLGDRGQQRFDPGVKPGERRVADEFGLGLHAQSGKEIGTVGVPRIAGLGSG
jgi:hypothetical protein